MIKFRFAIALLLTGCGSNPVADLYNKELFPSDKLPDIDIDAALAPYIESYVADATDRGVDTKLVSKLRVFHFIKIEQGEGQEGVVVGECYTFTNALGEIAYTRIDITEGYQDQEKRDAFPLLFKALLYHELSHCVLLRSHEPQDPEVIMSPTLSSESFYQKYWDQLLDQLFNRKPVQY